MAPCFERHLGMFERMNQDNDMHMYTGQVLADTHLAVSGLVLWVRPYESQSNLTQEHLRRICFINDNDSLKCTELGTSV